MTDEAAVVASGVCLDSNVFVQLMSPDETNLEIENFFGMLIRRGYFMYAPSLMQFEVANTFCKKERLHAFDKSLLEANLKRFYQFPVLLVWDQALIDRAVELQRGGLRSVYDASFLALAMNRKIPLVTEDKEILKKGRKLYPRVYTVREWLRQHS